MSYFEGQLFIDKRQTNDSMKALLLWCLCFIGANCWAQQTTVQTLNPQKCPNVNIKVPHELLKHESWDGGGIRVDVLITSNAPQPILDALMKANRYSLDGTKDGDSYIITAPNMEVPLSMGSKTMEENIQITISTPTYFAMNGETTLYKDIDEDAIRGQARSGSDTREEIEAVIKKMREIREDMNVHIKVQSTSKVQSMDLSAIKLTMKGKVIAVNDIAFPAFGN